MAGSLFLPVMLILVQIKFTTFQQLDGADPEVVVDFFCWDSVKGSYEACLFFSHVDIEGEFSMFFAQQLLLFEFEFGETVYTVKNQIVDFKLNGLTNF